MCASSYRFVRFMIQMDDEQIASHCGDLRHVKAAQIFLAHRFAIPGARIILFAPLVFGHASVNGALLDLGCGGEGGGGGRACDRLCKADRIQLQLQSQEY